MIPELRNLANRGQGKPGEAAIGGPLATDQFAIENGP